MGLSQIEILFPSNNLTRLINQTVENVTANIATDIGSVFIFWDGGSI
jgi:formiminotetrahydrofolate cyclodeaminase